MVNKYCLSLAIISLSSIAIHAMHESDRYKLFKFISDTEWKDFKERPEFDLPIPLYLKKSIELCPNKHKFTIANLILSKTDRRNFHQMRSRLKTIISSSFHPFELYRNNNLTLKSWKNFLNTEKSSLEKHQLLEDDVALLFKSFNLPESKVKYKNFIKLLYKASEKDDVSGQPICKESSTPQIIPRMVSNVRKKEQDLFRKLYHELKQLYGINVIGGQVRWWDKDDCTFVVCLSKTQESHQKLNEYVELQLNTIQEATDGYDSETESE